MSRRPRCAPWVAVVALVALASCSTGASVHVVGQPSSESTPATGSTQDTGSVPGSTSSTGGDQEAFHWSAVDNGSQTGTLKVPMDYDDPSKGSFKLYVARHPATDQAHRIGTLLVNPGGPGFGGSDFAIYADQVYGDQLLAKFDIVGWDPRGTGNSTPAIDCYSDYDHFYAGTDITPDDAEERQQLVDLAKEATDDCVQKNGPILPYIGTNNSARDMDAIRKALGEDTISYFGFSYGSTLGATWATLFPKTVRAAVLDGAPDPTADSFEVELQQSAGFEGTLNTFLAQCSSSRSCKFHNDGKAGEAFDALMSKLDEHPLPANPGRPDLTRGAAITGVDQAMYDQTYWPQLEAALAAAQDGDGSGLQDLYDQYLGRKPDGSYGNEMEAFESIICMDSTERPTVAEEDANAPKLTKVAPRVSPGTTGSYTCTFWPPATDPRITITGRGAGPILVMGTTGDPATPLVATENMAKALEDGRLVIVKGDQHTGYRINECSRSTVDNYLIDPEGHAPENGTRCD